LLFKEVAQVAVIKRQVQMVVQAVAEDTRQEHQAVAEALCQEVALEAVQK
jgi:hypothetical protein